MFKNALISVSDKTGLEKLAQALNSAHTRIVSTGGTAQILRDSGVSVLDVSEQTGFPEVMDGRVKTLHPKVHMCLLARGHVADDLALLEAEGLAPFDLVVGNLYPFVNAWEKQMRSGNVNEQEQVEYIDIGGPSFLRAAAKNYERITVVCDPNDYEWILNKRELTLDDRRRLAAKVFAHTSAYDSAVSAYLNQTAPAPQVIPEPETTAAGAFVQPLRYGENPHQQAGWYKNLTAGQSEGIHRAQVIQGKALSYNNILDIDAAVGTLREFDLGATCVAVKHNNPCGVGRSPDASVAVKKALAADPVSVFGGIVAINKTVDAEAAHLLSQLFLECVVAPEFSEDALQVFAKKPNLRILQWQNLMKKEAQVEWRSVLGGFLLQQQDAVAMTWSSDWKVVGGDLTDKVQEDLLFAWQVCAHLKSNAIAVAADGMTLGLGMGQVNRVDAVKQSLARAAEFHGGANGAVLASDAFFPFADSVELAADAGIQWIIQPGGSIKDDEVLAAAKKRGVGMVLTGQRHFRH